MLLFTLNNGLQIPALGSGTNTFGKAGGSYAGEINFDTTELSSAITLGYRHFDTAISYRNEAVIGKAIQESGIDRKEFFVTSKIPGRVEYYGSDDKVRQGVEESLSNLQMDYIDLYLIHHPWDNLEEMLSMWRVLETYVDSGVLKSIGVSNFNEEQLGYILEHGRIKPAVNQIQSNAAHWNNDIIEYSKANGVIPEAWGPMKGISGKTEAALTAIGKNYNKTAAQVVLRYQLERGVIVIPKSHNNLRQAANIDVFDFELSIDDKAKIEAL